VFTDNTALIVHPQGNCLTFFSKAGHKTRALSKFVVNSTAKNDHTGCLFQQDKLAVCLKFYNQYTRHQLLIKRPDQEMAQVGLFQKYTRATWPGRDNLA
jgi:hypothetical protein